MSNERPIDGSGTAKDVPPVGPRPDGQPSRRHGRSPKGFFVPFRRMSRMEVVAGLLLVAMVGLLLIPAIPQVRENAKRAACKSNLRQVAISLSLYADDFDGAFPENFQQLYQQNYTDNAKIFCCLSEPSSYKDFLPGGKVAEKSSSYRYVPGLNSAMPGDFIVAYDKSSDNHRKQGYEGGRNVLFVDSHVDWWPASREAEFQKLLAEQPALVERWNHWWFDSTEAQRRQTEAARQLGLPVEKVVDLGDGVKIDLVLIPAGRFRMGSPTRERSVDYDVAQHWVVLTRPFYLGKYEVTQEQWEKVMGANPSEFKGPRNPVGHVSWDDCQGFLKKLNALGKELCTFRLPSEAEWEWACRAGTRTLFCCGDDESALGEYAWYGSGFGGTMHPVGEKKPNAWGLYDCHGNVWEWCADWYGKGYYAESPVYDPTGPVTGDFRVMRGSSWFNVAGGCRSARRGSDEPGFRSRDVGCRLALSPSKAP